MVIVQKEVEIDGRVERYPVYAVPCDMEQPLELTRSDMDDLRAMHIAVEDTE